MPDEVAGPSEALMAQLRDEGWPFYLETMVGTEQPFSPVGAAVVGDALVGAPLVGCAVVVVGAAEVGEALPGADVVGAGVTGEAVVGAAVSTGCAVGLHCHPLGTARSGRSAGSMSAATTRSRRPPHGSCPTLQRCTPPPRVPVPTAPRRHRTAAARRARPAWSLA